DIPIIFVTAFADEKTLERAKVTEPYGYLLKPFEERELHTTIEMALYKHKMEQKLKESERWLSTTLNSIGDAVIATDIQGRITFMNPVAEALTGWPQTEALGIESTQVFNVISSETRTPIESLVAKVIREGRVIELGQDALLLAKDGSEIPVDDSVAPIRDEKGQITGTVLVFHDITERKQSEAEIRRRNRELVLLNRIIDASAAEPSPESILEIACREFALAFDLPQVAAALVDPKTMAAKLVADHRTEERPTILSEVLPVEADPVIQFLLNHKAPLIVNDVHNEVRVKPVCELMRQHGLSALLVIPLIVEKKVVGCLGLGSSEPHTFSSDEISLAWNAADQIGVALARSQLAQTHQLLTTAIEQAAESVVITDTKGIVLYVNPAFEQITGFSQAEVTNRSLRFLESDDRTAIVFEKIWGTIDAEGAWSGRLINKRKDGTRYTVDTTITPVRGEAGEIVNYVALQRDVTRELELEEQFHQAQKMEAIGQLAGGVAHDFNNLLTAINGFAELTQFQLEAEDPLQDCVGKILYAGRRAADLVRQLLAFSRKQVVQPQVLELNQVVAELDKMLGRIIGEHIRIRTVLPPDLWLVKVDPTQIEQIIVNLAVNARDAMPGGGQLTIETANVALDEDYTAMHLEAQPGDYVLLAVSDTGVGMSKDVAAHIFEPFFTTKEIGKGTGLGLATVYGIVQQSGGHIWVYSEEGQGTTFKIYLPRDVQTIIPSKRNGRSQALPRGSETILLVEDEPAVREIAARTLRGQDYIVLEAVDGQDALHRSREHGDNIQLLLTDMVMPGLNGRNLADRLAQNYPELKTLFMSGYTDNTVASHGRLDSNAPFIQKPFSPGALVRKVREVLDGSTSRVIA
ncbi:MAG: PAS domain S-box protein, partial [Anaerolineae bacterium]|nr:PAS domain S-box protein [Anaerolineae bacterium]